MRAGAQRRRSDKNLAADKHTLVVLDPGHFHAALSLRLSRIDRGELSDNYRRDLVAKYTLLARAPELSRRNA